MFLIDLYDVHLTSKVAYTHLSKKLNKLKWAAEKIKMLYNVCWCKIAYISYSNLEYTVYIQIFAAIRIHYGVNIVNTINILREY